MIILKIIILIINIQEHFQIQQHYHLDQLKFKIKIKLIFA